MKNMILCILMLCCSTLYAQEGDVAALIQAQDAQGVIAYAQKVIDQGNVGEGLGILLLYPKSPDKIVRLEIIRQLQILGDKAKERHTIPASQQPTTPEKQESPAPSWWPLPSLNLLFGNR